MGWEASRENWEISFWRRQQLRKRSKMDSFEGAFERTSSRVLKSIWKNSIINMTGLEVEFEFCMGWFDDRP